ncbi:hypothetical protein [Terrabacter sp. RAF57]|uniref:hypothetical protein n=1 Tax=Terrabacter sp. RAF57 TaxID=3233063 RepID=UPI003F961CA7
MGEIDFWRLDKSTPNDAWYHGRVRGLGVLRDDFRRGVDLAARYDLAAVFDAGGHSGGLSAAFKAQAQFHAGAEIAATIPLDLFGPNGAGLVGRLHAELALVGQAGLEVTYSATQLQPDLTRLLGSDLGELVDIFVNEVGFSAGIWVKGTFAASANVEASLVGSLLPDATSFVNTAGFTVGLDAHASWGFGGGYQLIVNAGIPDPDRLIGRLSDALARRTLKLIDAALTPLPRTPEATARAAAGLLVPVTMRAALQTGRLLADAAMVGASPDHAGEGIVSSVLTQARDAFFRALMEAAAHQVADALGIGGLADVLFESDDPAIAAGLEQAAAAFEHLSALDVSEVESVLLAVEDVLGAMQTVLTLPVVPTVLRDDIAPFVADLWTAAVLLDRLWTFAHDGDPADLFTGTPSSHPGAFADQFGGHTPTLGELVARVLDRLQVGPYLSGVPYLEDALEWTGTLIGVPPAHVLQTLLVDLVPPGPRTHDLLVSIGQHVGEAAESVVNHFLEPIRHNPSTPQVELEFINDFVEPLIVALPTLILPALADLGSEEKLVRTREAISMVLLHCLDRFLIGTTTILAKVAGETIAAETATLADDVHRDGWDSPVFNGLGESAALACSPEDIEGILRLVSNVAPDIAAWFAQSQQVIGDALDLGLVTAAGRNKALTTVLGTTEPVAQAQLNRAVDRCVASGQALSNRIGEPSLELLAAWGQRRIEVIGHELEQAMTIVVGAVLGVVHDLEAKLTELDTWIGKLGDDIAAALHDIDLAVGRLLDNVEPIARAALNDVRFQAHRLCHQILPPGTVRDTVDVLIDEELAVAQSIENQILGAVRSTVETIHQVYLVASTCHQVTPEGVARAVRNALVQNAPDVVISTTIVFIPVSITIPTAEVAGYVAGALLGHPSYAGSVHDGLAAANAAAVARQQTLAAEQQKVDGEHHVKAARAAADVTTGLPLSVAVEEVASNREPGGAVALKVTVRGVNRTFVDPWLGMAPRILLRVGNRTVATNSDEWFTTGDHELSHVFLLHPQAAAASPPAFAGAHLAVTPASHKSDDPMGSGTIRPPAVAPLPLVPPGHPLIEDQLSFVGAAPAAMRRRLMARDRHPAASGLALTGSSGQHNPGDDLVISVSAYAAARSAGATSLRRRDDDGGWGTDPGDTGTSTGGIGGTHGGGGGGGGSSEPPPTSWTEPPAPDPDPSYLWPTVRVSPGPVPVEVAVVDGAGLSATHVTMVPVSPPDPRLTSAIRLAAYQGWVARAGRSGDAQTDWVLAAHAVLADRIRARAFQTYLKRRRTNAPGDAAQDWVQAERIEMLSTMG